jgi:hypothetical protein
MNHSVPNIIQWMQVIASIGVIPIMALLYNVKLQIEQLRSELYRDYLSKKEYDNDRRNNKQTR